MHSCAFHRISFLVLILIILFNILHCNHWKGCMICVSLFCQLNAISWVLSMWLYCSRLSFFLQWSHNFADKCCHNLTRDVFVNSWLESCLFAMSLFHCFVGRHIYVAYRYPTSSSVLLEFLSQYFLHLLSNFAVIFLFQHLSFLLFFHCPVTFCSPSCIKFNLNKLSGGFSFLVGKLLGGCGVVLHDSEHPYFHVLLLHHLTSCIDIFNLSRHVIATHWMSCLWYKSDLWGLYQILIHAFSFL